ncbi:MAG: hypothetical protein RL885_00305 [Planctomycetota bacterium]
MSVPERRTHSGNLAKRLLDIAVLIVGWQLLIISLGDHPREWYEDGWGSARPSDDLGTNPILPVLGFLAFVALAVTYWISWSRRRWSPTQRLRSWIEAAPSSFRGIAGGLLALLTVVAAWQVLPRARAWAWQERAWADQRADLEAVAGRYGVPGDLGIDQLLPALREQSTAERHRRILYFIEKHRPDSGVRELLSSDGKIHVAIGAHGTPESPDGESLHWKAKGTLLNIAAAGDGRTSSTVLWGKGGSGGDIRVTAGDGAGEGLLLVPGDGAWGGGESGRAGGYEIGDEAADRFEWIGAAPAFPGASWDEEELRFRHHSRPGFPSQQGFLDINGFPLRDFPGLVSRPNVDPTQNRPWPFR